MKLFFSGMAKAVVFCAAFLGLVLSGVMALMVLLEGKAWWLFVYQPCMKECMTDLDEAVCGAEVCDLD